MSIPLLTFPVEIPRRCNTTEVLRLETQRVPPKAKFESEALPLQQSKAKLKGEFALENLPTLSRDRKKTYPFIACYTIQLIGMDQI